METQILERMKALESRLSHLERLEHAMAQSHGYIGGAWQKDPIRLGYSARIKEVIGTDTLSAGTNTIEGTTVPAGEIWVITNISMYYTGTVTGVILRASIWDTTDQLVLFQALSITSGQIYDRQGYWILWPGANLRLGVSSATLNDDSYLMAVGFRVDIDL